MTFSKVLNTQPVLQSCVAKEVLSGQKEFLLEFKKSQKDSNFRDALLKIQNKKFGKEDLWNHQTLMKLII